MGRKPEHDTMVRSLFPAALFCFAGMIFAGENSPVIDSEQGGVTVHPIEHASMVLESGDRVIAVDPVQGAERLAAFGGIDLVLVTDIHGDHFDAGTLQSLADEGAAIIAPAAVIDQMDAKLKTAATALANGEQTTVAGVSVEAIPMYNLTESRDFHSKGRGNGYVLELAGLRLYLSGDTEGVPEMRNLKDIDAAFVCMNLPYTMDVDQAADAVVEMKPAIVYPYHYRGQDGVSDVGQFAELVQAEDANIEIRQLDWYPDH
jgi:L-ascorbate metabolism protein UlaG (beta-lactamase superfamily)